MAPFYQTQIKNDRDLFSIGSRNALKTAGVEWFDKPMPILMSYSHAHSVQNEIEYQKNKK